MTTDPPIDSSDARPGSVSGPHQEGLERLYEMGLDIRREVLGADYVDRSLANADEFMSAFQRVTTEWCWGYAWSRDGLDRRTRSIINLAMLTALNRSPEIKLHVLGALNNGVSVEEIRETLLHATVYCGIPAGLDAFKAAHEALVREGAIGPDGRATDRGAGALAPDPAEGEGYT